MRTLNFAAVVLAAGSSKRLGRPKQDVILGTETLLQRTVRMARVANFGPLVVVVRPQQSVAGLEQPGLQIVYNEEASEGMASSVRKGVDRLLQADIHGAVILTCDQPLLRSEHLVALCADPARVTGSGYDGRIGVPAYFPASTFAQLLALRGDAGARALLRNAPAVQDEGLALDVDTEDDVRAAEALFATGRIS